jgi:uncharacterized protein YkwD
MANECREENNGANHYMRARVLFALMLAVSCVAPVSSAPTAHTPTGVPAGSSSAVSEDIVVRTNAQRRALGLVELQRVTKLMQAAQLHAEQMAATQRMSHDLPGTRYPNPDDRLAAVGYTWTASGENVAEGYADAAAVVAGWMKSPGHRANITSSRFTEMGAGVAAGANGRKYFVQVFATPR